MNLGRAAALTGLVFLAACDVPSSAPFIDQEWILPVESTSISVVQFLPAVVTLNGTRFSVSVNQIVATRSLGQVCSVCSAVNGQTGPAPAFSSTFSTSTNLPANVSGADIASGSVSIATKMGSHSILRRAAGR